jgi:ethanolamine ammonia-lyase small subunit
MNPPSSVPPDPNAAPPEDSWNFLRGWTPARIAMGRTGGSLPTRHLLDFRLSHALARDAVHRPLDAEALAREISGLGIDVMTLRSAVSDRATFLRCPDLGRRLSDESVLKLTYHARQQTKPVDLVVVCSDGLSAVAAQLQIVPVLRNLWPRLNGWQLAPLLVVPFARVALMDAVGELLNARLALILLGERPGLGSPDSLGAYFIHGPRTGRTDGERNCLSNIRSGGLTSEQAAETLARMLEESRRLGLSGVGLKDSTPVLALPGGPTDGLNVRQ